MNHVDGSGDGRVSFVSDGADLLNRGLKAQRQEAVRLRRLLCYALCLIYAE
jgi:hypothetical protein